MKYRIKPSLRNRHAPSLSPSLPQDLVILLVGAEHIKFGMGAPARLERLLASAQVPTAPGRGKVKSVLLNPSPQDSGSETKRLRLTLVRLCCFKPVPHVLLLPPSSFSAFLLSLIKMIFGLTRILLPYLRATPITWRNVGLLLITCGGVTTPR